MLDIVLAIAVTAFVAALLHHHLISQVRVDAMSFAEENNRWMRRQFDWMAYRLDRYESKQPDLRTRDEDDADWWKDGGQ